MSSCEWKSSPIFPNEYKVSENGDVWSNRSNRILRPATDKFGYLYYVLCVNGKRITVKAHRLVAMAFIPNKENKPTVDHINGIRADNRASNLRWATNKENTNNQVTRTNLLRASMRQLPTMYEAAKKINFNRKPVQITWNDGRKEVFPSLKEAAICTGSSYSKMSVITNGKRKQCAEFESHWADE